MLDDVAQIPSRRISVYETRLPTTEEADIVEFGDFAPRSMELLAVGIPEECANRVGATANVVDSATVVAHASTGTETAAVSASVVVVALIPKNAGVDDASKGERSVDTVRDSG
jgi:hypothetical protein